MITRIKFNIARWGGVLLGVSIFTMNAYACQSVYVWNKTGDDNPNNGYRVIFGNSMGLKNGPEDQKVLHNGDFFHYGGFSWGSTKRFVAVFALNATVPIQRADELAEASISDLPTGTIDCSILPNPVPDQYYPVVISCTLRTPDQCN